MNEEGSNRSGKKYIKTILFSAKADSIYVNLNPLIKLLLLILVSIGVVVSIDRQVPFLAYNIVVLAFALAFLAETHTIKFLVKSYLGVIIIALFVMFLWWIVFNQIGTTVLLSVSLLGMTLKVTTLSLYVGIGKITGYAAMVLLTLLTLMSIRDSDIIATLNRLKVPFKAVFFVSLISRSFNIMAEDLALVRQAQFARGASATNSNLLKKAKEFAMLSIPVTTLIIKRSVDVGNALEARGFSTSKHLSLLVEQKRLIARDYIMLGVGIAIALAPLYMAYA
ncbi:energy-coupling factor transporter transmembrane protein EcfT [Candidatus Marsarchaeota archaeon]|nr:energy-coupling factor transporter transmembrane protein EcfT [Candidatus Marsarchaeota archaeon]MCL5404841.1 energy-coupling factor transporter transmembrane protein EcfT [Candidatus Marsarchaeota archaeon]